MKTRFNNIPFNPARWPYFYGWNILLWGIIGILISAPGQTTGVSAFTEPLLAALGITRLQLSTSYMIGTVCSALILTPAGKLYDRVGSRWMAAASCLMLGMVLCLLSTAVRIGQAAAHILPSPVAMITVMSLLFFLLRFSGQGLLTLSSRNMVMKWFSRHRGLASGISGVAVGYGFANTPQLFHKWIGVAGWSSAWQTMGLIWILVCTPLILIFFRDNPEDCGLIPDGAVNPSKTKQPQEPVRSLTLPEARRTFVFWVFSLALTLQSLYLTAVTFHIESIFTEAGLDGARGFGIFPSAALISIVITLLGGWLSDHIALRWFFKIFLCAMAGSMTCLIFLSPTTIPFLIVTFGIASGLFGLLMSVTWPKYFGREHLGAISGLSMAMIVFGSAVGPMILSLSLKCSGSYRISLLLCLIMTLILFIGSFKAHKPSAATR